MKSKIFFIVFGLLSFSACDFFKPQQDKDVVAVVNQHILYKEDLQKVLPNNLSKEDSIIFVRGYIDEWAMDNLLMDNALYNIPVEEQDRYNKMVEKYKSELFKKAYLDALIQKEQKRNIDSLSIVNYYNTNKNNFKINEYLIKLRYIYANNELKDLAKIKKSFRRLDPDDINYLVDNELKLDKIDLNDSIWVKSSEVFRMTDGLNNVQQKIILSNKKYLEFEDTIGTYFIQVKDILKPNSIAPLSYIKPTIEQILRNKENLRIREELETKILNDAIKDKTYEILY